MKIIQLLLFLFSIFHSLHGGEGWSYCPSDYCGSFRLYYPFKLPDSSTQDSCAHINMDCNVTLDRLIVDLPYAGEFCVRDIDYATWLIQLYDPGNCTMKQLMTNWDLSASPYKPLSYENYTFYMCPSGSDILQYFVPINCLSNSTNSTVAIPWDGDQPLPLKYHCNLIGSWLLPVASFGQFLSDGVNGDLYLTWNPSICVDCDDQTQGWQHNSPGSSSGGLWDKHDSKTLAFGLALSFLVICSWMLVVNKCRRAEQINLLTDPASLQPPNDIAVLAAASQPRINICTELVQLGEIKMIPRPDNSDTACSICLERYEVEDGVTSIARCEHCFHAHCIELWLTKNSTCPVCRTALLDVSSL